MPLTINTSGHIDTPISSHLPSIILASTSPRRRELLNQVGIEFTTLSVDIDEAILPQELPTAYIKRMVAAKAQSAYSLLKKDTNTQRDHSITSASCLIITADTIGVLPQSLIDINVATESHRAGDILVKPQSKTDAYSMWRRMSGTTHSIWTAVQLTLIDTAKSQWSIVTSEQILEKTTVKFISLTEADMDAYWQSGEPQDKAGAYAIQGLGAAWVERIEGSYSNVVGLPLAQTLLAIKRMQP